jgi:transposase
LTDSEILTGLPDLQITGMERTGAEMQLAVRFTGQSCCPHCGSQRLRVKDSYVRSVRHESWGSRRCTLQLQCHKWKCRDCGRYFRSRFPGVLPWQRATEAFRRQIFQHHWDGINRSRPGKREGIGAATVERHFQHFLCRQAAEGGGAECPRVLGIDEHFFSRKQGYATTFCDLAKHRVYDVVLGRSEAALERYLSQLRGKDKVRVVCMDLSATYRALVRRHFPNAVIVTDRFHVIRLVQLQFLAVWRQLDPAASKNRGLLSLMRRHAANLRPEQKLRLDQYLGANPVLRVLYEVREQLCQLLLVRHRNATACRPLAHALLHLIGQLRTCGFAPLQTLGETLDSWKNEIARMWRFTRNNGITEGFHTKMEVLQRQAYGFRNFRNYRLRVVVMCC